MILSINIRKFIEKSHVLYFKKKMRKNNFPKRIKFRLHKKCNAKCVICPHWRGKEGLNLSTKKIFGVFEESKQLNVKEIVLTGGEPTLRTDLIQIIKKANKLSLNTCLNTNGSELSPDYIKQLDSAELKYLSISIDSAFKEVHDSIRGFPGLWEKAVNGIKCYKKINPNIKIKINTVIIKQNYKNIDRIIDLAKELDVKNISFLSLSTSLGQNSHPFMLTQNQLKEFYLRIIPNIIKKAKNSMRLRFLPFFINLVGKSNNYILNQLENHPEKFEEEIKLFSEGKYGIKFYHEYSCCMIKEELGVLENGDVYPCCSLYSDPEMKMGNVLNQSITEIWDSKKYKDFRNNPKKPKHEQCLKCKESFYLIT